MNVAVKTGGAGPVVEQEEMSCRRRSVGQRFKLVATACARVGRGCLLRNRVDVLRN